MQATIRDATPADVPAILAIVNDVIATSDAIFGEAPLTLENREAWFAERTAAGLPVLVADADGTAAGFASYGAFRAWPPGYRSTVEHSVHVHRDHRRRGLGRALLAALIERARADAGLHVLVAAIDGGNEASIALHERFSFTEVGRMPEIASKRGAWLDLVLMQLPVGEGR